MKFILSSLMLLSNLPGAFAADQTKMLKSVLEPSRVSWKVRDEEIVLIPSEDWVAIYNDTPATLENSQFWNAVEPKWRAEIVPVARQVLETGRTRKIYRFRRSQLKKEAELLAEAKAGRLPTMVPVYSGRGVVIPTGTITVRFKNPGEAAIADLRKFLREKGTEIRSWREVGTHGEVSFSLDATFPESVGIANEVAQKPFVQWCTPDHAMEILR